MAKHEIVVVGNGLFGSIAATFARLEGHQVTVVSDERAYSASKASGCVLAPTWLNSMSKESVNDAMAVLRALYTVIPVEFFSNVFNKTFKASRINPKSILVKPDVAGVVTAVGNGFVNVRDSEGGADRKLRGKVLLATGAWTPDLVPDMPKMKGLWGAALRIPGQLEEPRISVYAPYRQAVAFNIDAKTVWMGDGTALIGKTWDSDGDTRVARTIGRANELFNLEASASNTRVIIGVRPYVEGHKAGYYARLHTNTWVSTGGAKNGTVLAAWHAFSFLKELK